MTDAGQCKRGQILRSPTWMKADLSNIKQRVTDYSRTGSRARAHLSARIMRVRG